MPFVDVVEIEPKQDGVALGDAAVEELVEDETLDEILNGDEANAARATVRDNGLTPKAFRVDISPPVKQPNRALLVRLRPTGPWRIGPDSGDRDRVDRVYHSDSLYSAVCGAMGRTGLLEEWLDATVRPAAAGAPAVRFSSCFPFQANTLYVIPPRNLWPPAGSSKVRWKGATFVPVGVVDALINGELPKDDVWAIDNECLVPVGAGSGLFRASVRSSAGVDRLGSGVAAHSAACLEFTPQCGLWFLVAFANDAARDRWSDPVKAALRLLSDSGFGGKRSHGWGHAETPEFFEGALPDLVLKQPLPEGEAAHWLLSSFHPSAADIIDWGRGNYALTTRRGRIESDPGWGELKKPTRMVTEGSVLVAAADPSGSAVNVAPDDFAHPVYRAGFALSIPVPLVPLVPLGKASS